MDSGNNPNEKHPSVIRTMRTDAELYAKEKKLSTMQISASAYASQTKLPMSAEDTKSPLKMILFAGVVLLCVVVLGLGAWWLLSSKNRGLPAQELPPPPAIVFVDGQNILTIKQTNRASVVGAIADERAKTFRSGILNYYPIKVSLANNVSAYLQIKDLSKLLEWHTPPLLLENLAPDFNAYIFANKQTNDLAVIMKTTNFEKAFSSMLEWERALARDWQDFLNNISGTVAFPSAFQDEIIKNNDARILKKDDGSVIVGYTIFNKKYIVISTSREALGAIVDRLITLPPQ